MFAENMPNLSVRKDYGLGVSRDTNTDINTSHFDQSVPHDYLILNSLGRSPLTPTQVVRRMKEDWDKVFLGGATGQQGGGNRVYVGQVFRLPGPSRIEGSWADLQVRVRWGNYVEVVGITATTVTVETKRDHLLTGQVENGVFRDSTGELWLYNKGTGYDWERQRIINYALAPVLFRGMALKVIELIGSERWIPLPSGADWVAP